MAGRGFGNMVHPNAVVARRELERQEQLRLQRLAEVKTSPQVLSSRALRPSSASRARPESGRRRPRSRPPSAPAPSRRPPAPVASTHAEAGNGSECGPRLAPDEIQSQLMKQKLSPYEASVAYASVASRSQNPLVNGRAQSAPSKIPVTYLTSPQRRLEDAYNHLPSASEEEREALMEDEIFALHDDVACATLPL
ncbi:UVR8 [Symbiodinium sp. CCMP2592]|nr:UVR8 [Symbiodinium sp. CCMP2592]